MSISNRASVLYRFFSTDDDLLYVGISNSFPSRLVNHENDKPWWHLVASVKVEHFGTREAARAAELVAIKAESPAFNIADRAEGDRPRFEQYGITIAPPKPQYRAPIRPAAVSATFHVSRHRERASHRAGRLVPVHVSLDALLGEIEEVYKGMPS